MKVKVGDKIYTSEDQPIMVILTELDKRNITNMKPGDLLYSETPDGKSADEVLGWMMTGVDFERWKKIAQGFMKSHMWSETSMKSVDWEAWKECYFDDMIEPREAVHIEMKGG